MTDNLINIGIILLGLVSRINTNDVLGCGGFIKSHVQIDFSKVEVKLLTKQGILKDKTSCAPNNGYYFIPVYDKGEYILQLEPPPGWSFTPTKVHVAVDGKTDLCSQGKDINFVFKGFGITGRVESFGKDSGPAGISVELKSSKENRATTTKENGNFFFTPVYPGSYVVSISHPKWKILNRSVSVSVAEGNTELPPKSLVIQGYDVSGIVKSDADPVKNTKVLLFTKGNNLKLPVDGCQKSGLSKKFEDNFLCYSETNEKGLYTFETVPPGKYYIMPFYENQNIYFQPENIEFEVDHKSVSISDSFQIVGFSTLGRVVKTESGNGINGAKIFLNSKNVAVTNANGLYKLEKLKAGTYTIKVESDGLEFKELTLKLNPNIQQIPDILPHAYRVCGSVVSDKVEVVSFTTVGSDVHYTAQSDAKTGKFCEFLPVGKYNVHVELNDINKQKGLQFFPVSHLIEVPVEESHSITFSQLKATLTGEVKCIREKDCINLKVSIKPELSDDQNNNEKTVTVTGNMYVINDVTPGTYEVILHSNKLCWNHQSQTITVNDVKVTVPIFKQNGFSVIFVSSHDTEVLYKLPNESSTSSLKISKGRTIHCVEKPGNYIFQLSSCHTYEFDKIAFNTDSGVNELFLTAMKHEAQLSIKTDQNYGNLYATVDTGTSKQQIGPLSYENLEYKIKLSLAPSESVTITPHSELLYFDPTLLVITGGNECENFGVKFVAKKGKVFKGKVVPPLQGVAVTVETSGSELLVTETDSKGFYKFQPLDDSKQYKISAKKESYILVGPDNNGNFVAHKLAEIEVEVADEASKIPLQGALLSLSGGDSYRSNLQTNENGKITFLSLNPGQYFLRPMMKEYSFIPNSKMIDVKEGETVNVQLIGKRVAYSVYGMITSLNSEPEKNVVVIAEGVGNCSHLSEDSTSETSGYFRIRGLQPYCSYDLYVRANSDDPQPIERSAPGVIHIDKVTQDVNGLKMVVFRPAVNTDVLVKIYSKNPEFYKSLRLKVNRESSPYGLLHSSRVDTSYVKLSKDYNPGVLVHLPPIPSDGKTYSVRLDSNLPASRWDLQTVYFVANSSFRYITFDFHVRTNVSEQHIKQTSVWALILIFSIILGLYYIDSVIAFLKDKVNLFLLSINDSNIKKSNNLEYSLDNTDIDQIVESINATKRKPKSKRA